MRQAPVKLEFHTRRFVMRPYVLRDYAAWRSAYASMLPKQNEFDLDKKKERELGLPEFRKLLAKNARFRKLGVIYHLGIFEKKTGRLMGFLLFALIERFNVQSARISYIIMNNYWKHGYGKEVVHGAALFAFKKLKLHRLEAEIQPHNRASVALVKSVGFQYEGIRRGAVYFEQRWHDHAVYALLAEDLGIRNPKPRIFL